MQQNAYLVAKIVADTGENERNFAEILLKTDNYPTGPQAAGGGERARGGREALRRALPEAAGRAARGPGRGI